MGPTTMSGDLIPRLWLGEMGPAATAAALSRDLPTLWLIDRNRLPSPASELRAGLLAVLAQEERSRLEALHRHDDRERFLLGRAVLRLLLASRLNRAAAELPIVTSPGGKPRLDVSAGASQPQFNVSHSGALILIGIHPSRPLGIDVERPRPGLDWRPIARRRLTAEDNRDLEALPRARQEAGFLQRWCRLEARLKALGTGFAMVPGPPPTGAREGAPALVTVDVRLWGGYHGALALAGACRHASTSSGPSSPAGEGSAAPPVPSPPGDR